MPFPINKNVGKANLGNIDDFPAGELKSERIPRSSAEGLASEYNLAESPAVEDSPQLAVGSVNCQFQT
jgi:hypothetical protein